MPSHAAREGRVRYLNLEGNENEIEPKAARHLPAHEIDHLNGVLFIDHIFAAQAHARGQEVREGGETEGSPG